MILFKGDTISTLSFERTQIGHDPCENHFALSLPTKEKQLKPKARKFEMWLRLNIWAKYLCEFCVNGP